MDTSHRSLVITAPLIAGGARPLNKLFALSNYALHPPDDRIQDVLVFMNRHYAENIEITTLARLVSLSPSRLSHLFKEQMGQTITERLSQIRLRRAASMLHSTSMQVTDIAFAVGFNSLSFFTRKFNREYGVTPTRYRKQCRYNPLEI